MDSGKRDAWGGLFGKASGLEFVGPFEQHRVILHDHEVPFLSAYPRAGQVYLGLDARFGIDLTMAEAERFVPFLADAIAVALGYTCHPCPECPEPGKRLPFPRTVGLGSLETD